jgi:hypothetical protein
MTSPRSALSAGKSPHHTIEHIEHLSRTVVAVWPRAVCASVESYLHRGERAACGVAVQDKSYLRGRSSNDPGIAGSNDGQNLGM